MVGSPVSLASDNSDALPPPPAPTRADWLRLIEQMGDEAGYFEPLGAHHWAVFSDDGPTLLVTFETLERIQTGAPGQMPFSHNLATQNGWSHLCLISEGESWYREPSVYRYLDRLVDDAFFEDFDRVVFYGAGMAGYAACAFSVVAPGALVLAVQPRATLDPGMAGWDRRHLNRRRLNFSDRYGYAPDMIDGAGQVFVILDPMQAEDAMHAALFRAPHVTYLHTRYAGSDAAQVLQDAAVLTPVLQAAGDGKLTAALFRQAWRARRGNVRYLKGLLQAAVKARKPQREAAICRWVTTRMRAPAFRRHLTELEAKGMVAPATEMNVAIAGDP